ncbi:relaxase/mobilization nuclease domain-containing protein [Proteiniborus sp. MB09-C3]|uniref:relaxase/mobilization nuclease domain-containing protein n=1 Tax=Proteiniborus sp. MB09-C3 TaxID=3050072 RepID=UPI002552F80F|nr:relaxase/mobilization nuclease domain-containing protein [Proteiniborus sp. MB09-C3]WIV11167.1 relaxase/mobilization nuclease domain-containing protein [Proteiniborus sp. MB09-C3]
MANFGETEPKNKKVQEKSDLKGVTKYAGKEEKTEIELMEIADIVERENVEELFKYVTQNKKTKVKLMTGINCLSDTDGAYNDMILVKKMYRKEGGRMFKHFYHSYSDKENLDPLTAHQITLDLISREKRFEGFQIFAATHIDKGHLHTHIILNTVNIETGKKWQQSNTFLSEMKELSNEVCKEYGLKYSYVNTGLHKNQRKNMDRGELRAKKEYRSWKNELKLTINDCIKVSISKSDFIKNMNKLGYKVRWEDTRKYITFITPDNKKCRDIKLEDYKNYTKEKLLKRFELNKQIYRLSDKELKYKQEGESWKTEAFYTINDCKKVAASKEDFIFKLEQLGYQVRWEDSRKDITFIFSVNGKVRKCNSDKFHPPGIFSKENLLKTFKLNSQHQETTQKRELQRRFEAKEELVMQTIKILEKNPDLGHKDYPRSFLEGQALKEKFKEKEKGDGLDWER